MRILKGQRGPVRALAYAPDDDETLASLGGEAVRLWNLPRGESWARFPAYGADRAARAGLVFSPDGNRLIVSAGSARMIDVVGERWAGALGDGYLALAFSPDGRVLAAGQSAQQAGADGWLRLFQWLLAAPSPRRAGPEGGYYRHWEAIGLEGDVTELAWSPDGRLLAAAHAGQKVALWLFEPEGLGLLTDPRNLGPLSLRKFYRVGKPVAGIAFVPGADLLLAVAAGPTVELWDADIGSVQGKRRQVLRGHKGAVRALAVSPDGRLLLSGGADGTVRLWDTATWLQRQSFDWGLGAIHTLAFAPDGMTAVVGGDRPDILVWDVDDA
jgi:WD40 repeat protein